MQHYIEHKLDNNNNNCKQILDLLKIQGLDKYWVHDNIILNEPTTLHEKKAKEIQDSLNKYPINNFVVLDDLVELKDYFPNNTVITKDYMSINNMNECIKILKKTR